MAPKKPNGFMEFVMEWKGKQGRRMNLDQAKFAAGEIWQKMSVKQREPYLKRAQAAQPVQKKGKLTCVGTPLAYIEKQLEEKAKREEIMLETIERTIKLAVEQNTLKSDKFYFVMVNYFVRLLNSDTYVPAEIAIVEFSLLEGVSRKYHALLNPEVDLYGNVYDAQHHADTTHKLPLPPNALGERDLWKVSSDILKFVYDNNTGTYPPLYTHNKAFDYVSSALTFLSEGNESEDTDLRQLNVHSIQELFYALKCAVCDIASIVKPRNRFITDAILERDAFEYASHIACGYHEDIDRSNYCALSQVHRWAYSFADYMAKDLSITFIPGRHMPPEFDAFAVNATCNEISTLSIKSVYEMNSETVFKNGIGYSSVVKNLVVTSLNSSSPPATSQQQQTGSVSRKEQPSARKIKKASETTTDFSFYSTEEDYNPWKRTDDTKPPESRFFSIDYDSDDGSSISVASRCLVRGRGIAILNDFTTSK